ncbi:hypothetical protein GHT06_012017 [Daphnia sinensis]|uniref:Galectin n=1 Tax=Daphnia sinensis TaxID=1820382 RepID=A0AAD5PV90_9CRUS|nr:hypothetical protein GHT06_012017 [Daphnia sinensis]
MTLMWNNPTIPFTVSLAEKQCVPGRDFVFVGDAFYGAQRFSISFVQTSSGTRLFQLEFRFDHNETVLNANFPEGGWGEEERHPLPLLMGRKFNIEVKCSTDRFMIIVDFQYHSEFVFRFDMNKADTLMIEGDVNIQSVQID